MLIKSPTISQVFARHKEEKQTKPLSRQQWIVADRIVMAILFLMVLTGAIFFA
jgi:ABC-type Na+ efflux pump permease subunit